MVEERPVDHVASADGQWIPAPPRVPEAVTALQGMLALNQAGHLQAVELLFQADDTPYRLAYQRAQEWLRTSPQLHASPDGLDRCFRRPAIPRR